MVDTVKVTDAYGREVEVEAGADGENPVSPNNPPAKAGYVDRRDLDHNEEDESVGSDGENPVSPNNPPENTQTVSPDAPGGFVPEGVDEVVAEAAANNQYPASYQPVKPDVENGQPVSQVVTPEADAEAPDESEPDEDPVVEAADNEQEPVSQPDSSDS